METINTSSFYNDTPINFTSPSHGIQHVAIAGAGIAGLCTALALVRKAGIPGNCIEMFEPRQQLDTGLGAGLNLNSGAAILSREYGVHVSNHGIRATRALSTLNEYSTTTMSSTTKTKSESTSSPSTNVKPDSHTFFDIDFSESFANTYLSGRDGSPHVVTILREQLQSDLNRIVTKLGVKIYRGSEFGVKDVNEDRTLVLSDGSITERAYDLVIGADGVRSRVREAVLRYQQSKTKKKRIIRKKGKKLLKPRYTGVRVAWLVTEGNNLDGKDQSVVRPGEMRQIICDGAAVVAYAVSKQSDMIAFLYRDEDPGDPKKYDSENVGFEENDEVLRREAVVRRMRRANVPEHIVRHYKGPGGRFIESAVHEHALLPQWSRNRIVLVGDAAHAMAPFLGQGANQTIQDAHVLALSLRQVGNEYSSVEDALRGYERTFRKEILSIARKSRVLGFVFTREGVTGYLLRHTLLAVSRRTGLLKREIVNGFHPRFL